MDFLAQARRLQSQALFRSSPLLTTHTQVHASYPTDLAELPRELCEVLEAHGPVLAPALRRSLAQAVILLHNRGALQASAAIL